MTVNDMADGIIDVKVFSGIPTGLLCMGEAMQTVGSSVLCMPVIEIKIMEHGSCDQSSGVGMQEEPSVYSTAESGNIFTVFKSGYISVLKVFFHFLYMTVGGQFPKYFFGFVIIFSAHLFFPQPGPAVFSDSAEHLISSPTLMSYHTTPGDSYPVPVFRSSGAPFGFLLQGAIKSGIITKARFQKYMGAYRRKADKIKWQRF